MVLGNGDDVHIPGKDEDERYDDTDEDMDKGVRNGSCKIGQAGSLAYKVNMSEGTHTEQWGDGGHQDQNPGHQEEEAYPATGEDCGVPAVNESIIKSAPHSQL